MLLRRPGWSNICRRVDRPGTQGSIVVEWGGSLLACHVLLEPLVLGLQAPVCVTAPRGSTFVW